ncbi:exonuclease domain-containing protein [Melissospora conviva]|uniref:exonuclease domain-containing protein n=1 Tax=Melissospora conviva TaxID=3388432 RepID=UPI003C1B1014
MYAVIDVETTGLYAGRNDRIAEVAVVHVDADGQVTGEWCSLVNPDRDLGPQHVHGISAADVRQAPPFARLAGQVAELLRGRVLVAHNLSFDARFLTAEYLRLGISAPIHADEGLCTMRLASHFLPGARRSLQHCRTAAGLSPHRAHSALHDAHAAAELLGYYLKMAGTPAPWTEEIAAAARLPWPAIPVEPVAPVLRRAVGLQEGHFLSRLVDRLPRLHEPQGDAYLDLLDQALLDRYISAGEVDALVDAARELGLARADVEYLHRVYLAGLAAVALEDGVLTPAEQRDLVQVAQLLGLSRADVDHALAAARTRIPGQRRPRDAMRLHAGDIVVFTGDMRVSRETLKEQARVAGLVPRDGVTKKTRILVAADPDSMSGKAKQAQRYGIPIVPLPVYQQLLAQLP